MKLSRTGTGILVIDIQERLAPAIEPVSFGTVVDTVRRLGPAARELGLPVVISEQYPQGLGASIAPVREAFPEAAIAKTTFSAMGTPEFAERVKAAGVDAWVVVGIEAHICVFQTIRDLLNASAVVVLADGVASRTATNREIGLRMAERAGAQVSCLEAVLFDLLQGAKDPSFKVISALVK